MVPDLCAKFQPCTITFFELEGLKLKNNNNNNNKKKKKNCKNELPLIFHTSPMQILVYFRQTCISDLLPVAMVLLGLLCRINKLLHCGQGAGICIGCEYQVLIG